MILPLILTTSIMAAEHKPGETCSVVCKDSFCKVIIAATDLDTFVGILRGIEEGDSRPLTEAEEDGSLIKVPNATFKDGKVEMVAGQVLGVIKGHDGLPDITKVQFLTKSGRGEVAYLRDEYLMLALELAVYTTQLEKAEKEAKELAAKLAAIDPAEVSKAIRVAKSDAGRADLSVRKRAYARERSKRLAPVAKKYGVTEEALDAWIKARRIEK